MRAALVDVSQLDAVAEPDAAAVRLIHSREHLEQRRLAGAVWADHANDTAGRQAEGQIVDQQPVVEGFRQAFDLQHDAPNLGPGGI